MDKAEQIGNDIDNLLFCLDDITFELQESVGKNSFPRLFTYEHIKISISQSTELIVFEYHVGGLLISSIVLMLLTIYLTH